MSLQNDGGEILNDILIYLCTGQLSKEYVTEKWVPFAFF